MKPTLEYRPKARVAQRKERSLPKRKAASSTPAASAKEINARIKNLKSLFEQLQKYSSVKVDASNCEEVRARILAIGAEDSSTLARIREKTRLRVQKHRKKRKGGG